MIANCGHDERGKYTGGKAGDQSGTEWYVRKWYSYPWNCVIRHPDPKIGEMIAELAKEAANNDNIGYDQWERYTFRTQLFKSKYHPKNIKTKCEADCSSGTIAITQAVGYLTNNKKLYNLNATYTGNMKAGYKAAGFQILTDKKYLTSDKYLLPGDILLNTSYHTCINLDKGSKVKTTTNPAETGLGTVANCEALHVRTDVKVPAKGEKDNQCSFSPIKKGTKVEVVKKIKSAYDNRDWYYIKYQGKYGYVVANYIKI